MDKKHQEEITLLAIESLARMIIGNKTVDRILKEDEGKDNLKDKFQFFRDIMVTAVIETEKIDPKDKKNISRIQYEISGSISIFCTLAIENCIDVSNVRDFKQNNKK